MIVAAVISGVSSAGKRSLSTISASDRATCCRLRLPQPATRRKGPPSSPVVRQDVVAGLEPLADRLLPQDRDSGLEIGRLDVGDESPLEARAHALLEAG